ncbi:hypothetical protein G2W53_040028 [Senna tora]|uniref:Uncharacterized protein n=1 Tax=Senna tora TaxID=362788 RepID=A0A834SQF1_9FABA|nr:hypothetical protein G2W53_040028 [Senna tora]
MATARPFEMLSIREVFALSDDHSPVTTQSSLLKGEALERVIILGDSREGSDEVMAHSKGYPIEWCPSFTFRRVSGFWIFCVGWLRACAPNGFVEVPPFLPKGINSLGVVIIVRSMPLCCLPIDAEVVFVKILGRRLPLMQRSSRHYTGEGCGRRNMSKEDCYLVDPASSHMLVSKIKPCMCKYETNSDCETANGSLNQL